MNVMTRSGAKFWWKRDLPRHVAYMMQKHGGAKWEEVTYKSILDKKRSKQSCELQIKRLSTKRVPCFVWVFKNSENWFFSGWWIYIKTIHNDFGINFRVETDWDIVEKAMAIYPCGVLPKKDFFSIWAEKFAKQYQHIGFKRKRNQGIAKAYCIIDGNGRLEDLLQVYEMQKGNHN